MCDDSAVATKEAAGAPEVEIEVTSEMKARGTLALLEDELLDLSPTVALIIVEKVLTRALSSRIPSRTP